MKLDYIVKTDTNTYQDSIQCDDQLHLKLPLDGQIIQSVVATLSISMKDNEKVFNNGYQTWTQCREYSKQDKIRGLHGVPQFVIDKYSFDRYGDYHFVNYPNTKGITHGFTYCYFKDGDNIFFIGSLNEHSGYTMFNYDANKSLLTIEKDCSGIKVKGEYELLDLIFINGSMDEVFDSYFDALNIKPRTSEKLYGYSSWYNRYQNIDESAIEQDLNNCTKIFKPGDLFQIDDGWEPYVGDWLQADSTKFSHGMKYMVDKIHDKGFKAGLWLAPFVAEEKSSLFQNHQDCFLMVDNKAWKDGCNWSGFYSLDIRKKEVIDYIKETFDTVLNKWGFDLVKLDFLYGGAPYGDQDITRATLMYQGVDLLRQLCGDKLILGCGVPSCVGWGVFDYCRISCDVSLDWDDKWFMRLFHRERTSTKMAIRNIISRYQWNNRVYGSDPDVFFLRDNNIKLSKQDKLDLILLDALCGNVFLTSDDPGNYSQEMIDNYNKYRYISGNGKLLSMNINNGIDISYQLDGNIINTKLFSNKKI